MAMLERNGVRLRYEIHGTGPGTPMLLTHGYGASGAMWDDNVPALAVDRTVITWDMRGHGSSDAPEDGALYSHGACVGDMASLLELGGFPAVLCGMSLGGFLSLRSRLSFPARVRALVLVDTGPGFRDAAARERWNGWARELADDLDTRGVEALPSGREQAHAVHLHGLRGIAHAARGMLVQEDSAVFESLGEIDVPTLVVVGSEDTQFLAAADVMESRVPGARKLVLAGAGHAANMDAPEQFNLAVTQFLEEL
jgi:pimeloyl-ACP methyl ester carboxylesterase